MNRADPARERLCEAGGDGQAPNSCRNAAPRRAARQALAVARLRVGGRRGIVDVAQADAGADAVLPESPFGAFVPEDIHRASVAP